MTRSERRQRGSTSRTQLRTVSLVDKRIRCPRALHARNQTTNSNRRTDVDRMEAERKHWRCADTGDCVRAAAVRAALRREHDCYRPCCSCFGQVERDEDRRPHVPCWPVNNDLLRAQIWSQHRLSATRQCCYLSAPTASVTKAEFAAGLPWESRKSNCKERTRVANQVILIPRLHSIRATVHECVDAVQRRDVRDVRREQRCRRNVRRVRASVLECRSQYENVRGVCIAAADRVNAQCHAASERGFRQGKAKRDRGTALRRVRPNSRCLRGEICWHNRQINADRAKCNRITRCEVDGLRQRHRVV